MRTANPLLGRVQEVLLAHQRVTPGSAECLCGSWDPFGTPFHEHLVAELRAAGVRFAATAAPIPPAWTYRVAKVSNEHGTGGHAYRVELRRGGQLQRTWHVDALLPFATYRLRRRLRHLETTYAASREDR